MRLEDRFDGPADDDVLTWIAEQVADHPDPAGVRQLDEDDDVRPGVRERGMHGYLDDRERGQAILFEI